MLEKFKRRLYQVTHFYNFHILYVTYGKFKKYEHLQMNSLPHYFLPNRRLYYDYYLKHIFEDTFQNIPLLMIFKVKQRT